MVPVIVIVCVFFILKRSEDKSRFIYCHDNPWTTHVSYCWRFNTMEQSSMGLLLHTKCSCGIFDEDLPPLCTASAGRRGPTAVPRNSVTFHCKTSRLFIGKGEIAEDILQFSSSTFDERSADWRTEIEAPLWRKSCPSAVESYHKSAHLDWWTAPQRRWEIIRNSEWNYNYFWIYDEITNNLIVIRKKRRKYESHV